MLLFSLIILYAYAFLPKEKVDLVESCIVKFLKLGFRKINLLIQTGSKIKNGLLLEEYIQREINFGINILKNENLPIYKHFTELYERIKDVGKKSGHVDEEKKRLFCQILSADLRAEKKLREYIVNNIAQMSLIGLIILGVFWMTIFQFEMKNNMGHFYFQLIMQIFGVALFTVTLKRTRKKYLGPFTYISSRLQLLIIYCCSGYSIQKVLSESKFHTLVDAKFTNSELEQLNNLIIQSIRGWQLSGLDPEQDLIFIHKKMELFFESLNKKCERVASFWRLASLTVFYLGSYLVNILILLQTFLNDSFYTPSTL